MSPYERCLAVVEGRVPDIVPCFTPTIACDVAGKILGRKMHSGSPSLWYAEAKAWLNGATAFDEFEHQLGKDLIDLNRTLGNDILRLPWRIHFHPTAEI